MGKERNFYADNVPELNSDGQLVGPLIPRSDTKANIDAIVLELGEVAHYTDITGHAVGDSSTAGGMPEIIKVLDSVVTVDSSTYVDVLEIAWTAAGNEIWEIAAHATVEMTSSSDDPQNFKLRVNSDGPTVIDAGASSHPDTDSGTTTLSYQTTNTGTLGLGGTSVVYLMGGGTVSTSGAMSIKLQIGQVSTDAVNTVTAKANLTSLRIRRIA